MLSFFSISLEILRPTVDYEKLHSVTKVVTENLNNVIDINYYPTDKTKRSNILHRPIGIGVQGLADLFIELELPFTSEMAKEVNKNIFETIYHAALESSNEIAIERYNEVKEKRYDQTVLNTTAKKESKPINISMG